MNKTITFKRVFTFGLFIFLLCTGLGIYFVYNIKSYIKQGIDLVGGTLITLDVDVEKAYEQGLQHDASVILKHLQSHGVESLEGKKVQDGKVLLIFSSEIEAGRAYAVCADLNLADVLKQVDDKLILSLNEQEKKKIANHAIGANIQALRNRLDPFGAGEILITPQGNRIVIELPNVQNPEQARSLIGKAAHLSIKPVLDVAQTKEALLAKYDDVLPEDTVMCPDEVEKIYYLLPAEDALTGRFLQDACLAYDPQNGNRPVVEFSFNSVGAAKFRLLTRENIGNQVAVVLDDVVITAPAVHQEIAQSRAHISGNFTAQEAQNLATMLKSGSFVAPVKFAEEKIIGPALGWEAVKKGLSACVVGLILLLIASLVIYKTCGILAFIVLLYNLLLSLIGMWILGATLTLSGIAGMILTVGMAVDASILIFERIKEELALGKNFKQAVEGGFKGAMAVIMDANITHFIIALVLYKMGAGPLRGFAVTMIVGIIATIVSGIYMLKGFFNYFINTVGVEKLKI